MKNENSNGTKMYPTISINEREIMVKTILEEHPDGCFINTPESESIFHFDDAFKCVLTSFHDDTKNFARAVIPPHSAETSERVSSKAYYQLHLLLPQKQYAKHRKYFTWLRSDYLKRFGYSPLEFPEEEESKLI